LEIGGTSPHIIVQKKYLTNEDHDDIGDEDDGNIPCSSHESKSYHHFTSIDVQTVKNHVFELSWGIEQHWLRQMNDVANKKMKST
jgi:hypothetical protein